MKLASELPSQQVQRPDQYWREINGSEVDCDSQQGKQCWQLTFKKNIHYSYTLTCLVVVSLFFHLFPSVVVVVDFINTIKSI